MYKIKNLPNLEKRAEQQAMLDLISDAINQKHFTFIEADTGVGKSLAYLLPAITHILETNEKCVISTHTIALQEQILNKELPFILGNLQIDLEPILVKGMGNYLCLRKLYDLLDHPSFLNLEQTHELREIEQSVFYSSTDGSLSELSVAPQQTPWDKLQCEKDACSFIKCPHYKSCYFFKARKKIKDSNLLIVNHSLLLADVKAKSEDLDKIGILPEYENLVIDEAHTFEDTALESLSSFLSTTSLLKKLAELQLDQNSKNKLARLYALLLLMETIDGYQEKAKKISSEIIPESQKTYTVLVDALICLGDFLDEQSSFERKLVLNQQLMSRPNMLSITEQFKQASLQLQSFVNLFNPFIENCKELKNEHFVKKTASWLVDLEGICQFLNKSSSILKNFFKSQIEKEKIHVIEWNVNASLKGISFKMINLNVSKILSEHLFDPLDFALLCSATLSLNKSFKFIKKQLGFNTDESHKELLLDSPFDYKKQLIFGMPTDLEDVNSYGYVDSICKAIKDYITQSKGGAFILFTSFKTLNTCYEQLNSYFEGLGLLVLKQGDVSKKAILESFQKESHCVLFGTDTFWEGIDVPGFNLRLVILTKIPFPVPTDPIYRAKCDQIEKNGQNPFLSYAIPKAIIKFKQGFGRLIRNKKDFGAVICLDSRLSSKKYGAYFLKSIPKCKIAKGLHTEVLDKVKEHFKESVWSVTESNR